MSLVRLVRSVCARCLGLVGGTRRDRDLDAEIRSHIDLHVRDNVRAGMTPDAARRAALARFGSVEGVKETYRDRRGLPWVDTLVRDARDGLRVIRRAPAFALATILTLALGIGAVTTVFQVINGVAFRNLPVREADRLVQLFAGSEKPYWSNPVWEQVRDRPDLLDAAFAWSRSTFNLAERGEVQPADGLFASPAIFDVLEVRPVVGRLLTAADDRRGGGPDGLVAVLGHDFWRRQFDADPSVVGRATLVNRVPVTIVGVADPSFHGPAAGRRDDIVLALAAAPRVLGSETQLDQAASFWLQVQGRLKADQSLDQARAALQAASPAVRDATLPSGWTGESADGYLSGGLEIALAPAGPTEFQRYYRQPLVILMVATALVLLIAAANLANLFLARTSARQPELAMRLALGASSRRIARQLLTETFLLALAGTAIGLVVAWWGSAALIAQLSTSTRTVFVDLAFDWRVASFVSVVTVLVTLLVGASPALGALRLTPSQGSGRVVTGEHRFGTSSALVAAQVTLSLVLVIAAGLFGRSFVALASRDVGFERDVLLVTLDARPAGLDPEARRRVFEDIRRAVAALPDVQDAALSAVTPISNNLWTMRVSSSEAAGLPETDRPVYVNLVSPAFFDTYGMALIAGRDFTPADSDATAPVVLVNEAFARRYFPGTQATARFVRREDNDQILQVVGVVGDAVYSDLRETPPPTMYRALPQSPAQSVMMLSVRPARGTPMSLSPSIAGAVSGVDRNLTLVFRTLDDQLGAAVTRERLLALLAASLGLVGVALAGVGIYGVLAYAVARRRSEIGVRLALGASRGAVARLVVGSVGRVMALSLAVGTVVSLWLAGFVESLLFGISARDWTTSLAAVVVLSAVGLLASWWPVHRATAIDPTTVLRR